jgi:hypothetical protein
MKALWMELSSAKSRDNLKDNLWVGKLVRMMENAKEWRMVFEMVEWKVPLREYLWVIH